MFLPQALPANRLRSGHGPLLRALAWKNVRLRYKASMFGFLWTLLHPLLFLGIFLLIFRNAFTQVPNYPVFALTGLIFWTFFATSSGHMLSSLTDNASLLKSLALPPLAFPLAQLLAGLFNLLLSLIPFLCVLMWFGWRPAPAHVLIVPITFLFAAFLFGIGLALCALHVYFRDVGHLWTALLPALFYLTPIAYPAELVPADMRWVAALNPLYHFIDLVRTVLVQGLLPTPMAWITSAAIALLSLLIGLGVHGSLRRGYIANY
jgi:ABC-2 type transport system permease protein